MSLFNPVIRTTALVSLLLVSTAPVIHAMDNFSENEYVRRVLRAPHQGVRAPGPQTNLRWEDQVEPDLTLERIRRRDWDTLNPIEQEKETERCEEILKTMQSRFIPGNGKSVFIPLSIVFAILKRPEPIFRKNGNMFKIVDARNYGKPPMDKRLVCIPTEEGWATKSSSLPPNPWSLSFRIIPIDPEHRSDLKLRTNPLTLSSLSSGNPELEVVPMKQLKQYEELSEEDRKSPIARQKLLEGWEVITSKDFRPKDRLRIDWLRLHPKEQEADLIRCEKEIERIQTRFIPGNGKRVVMPRDILFAILDRPDKIFCKDGHTFELIVEDVHGPIPSNLSSYHCLPLEDDLSSNLGWETSLKSWEPGLRKVVWSVAFKILKIDEKS